MGVVKADPVDYVQRYGASLKYAKDMPQFVLDIKTPDEYGPLAVDYRRNSLVELEGQLSGFNYVNLDHEGLGHYRSYLLAKGIRDLGADITESFISQVSKVTSESAASQIFSMIDIDNSGSISLEEAEKIVLKLNSRLKRAYGEVEVKDFFEGGQWWSKYNYQGAVSKGFY